MRRSLALLSRGKPADGPIGQWQALHDWQRAYASQFSPVGLPEEVTQKLEDVELQVLQTQGAGRGIFAKRSFLYGEPILEEKPYVCHPALPTKDKVCYNCLRGLLDQSAVLSIGRKLKFCSPACLEEAEIGYLEVETDGRFGALDKFCDEYSLRFPLLIKRLTSMAIQQGNQIKLQALEYLVHANMPEIPETFVKLHGHTQSDWSAHSDNLKTQSPNEHTFNISLASYVKLYTRLALNSFRVDGIMPGPVSSVGMTEPPFAANFVAGTLGSCVYLTASMFNHSCCHNVHVTHPSNNGEAQFTAARDIEAGEQLFITYIDSMLPRIQRQEQLMLNYGFVCQCEQCTEES